MKNLELRVPLALSLLLGGGSFTLAQDKQPVSSITGQAPQGASRIEVGLAFAQTIGSTTFSSSQTIREYAEDGKLNSSYKVGGAPGGGFHLQYNLTKEFGVRIGAQTFSRKSEGTFEAQIPHPFFFAKPRTAKGTQSGLAFSEAAYSLTGVYRGGTGKWSVSLEGGAAYFSVNAAVAERVSVGDVYPYDTVTFSGIVSVKKKASPIGLAAGIELGREISRAVSAVAQVRFTQGSGDLDINGQKVSIKAGGTQARLGLRIVLARKRVVS